MVKPEYIVEILKQSIKFKRVLMGFVLYIIATNVASAAIVTITMDDEWDGQYKYAYPILHDRNIHATVFVYTWNIGKTSGNGTNKFLTLPQLTEMRDAGFEIGSHTITHADLTTLNDSQLEYEVYGSKNYLITNGFNPQTFAYPYGKYNDNVTEVVKKYYFIARDTNQGMNQIPSDITIFNLDGRGVDNQDETIIKGWIDAAIANNQWLILYFHQVNESGYINSSVNERGQNLTAIADYIKYKVDTGQLKALTFYQGWLEATKISPPNPANLLANPGFESGTTQPLNWNLITVGSSTLIWDTVSHTGAKSIKISNPGTTNSQSGYPQSDLITAAPLQDYTFSAWVKTLNAGGDSSPTVRVDELDVNMNWIRQTSLYFSRGTNNWTNKQTSFQTTINTKYLYVYANIWNGYGTFWVDDVVLSSSTSDSINPVINTVILNTFTPNTGDAILVSVDATDNVAVTGVEANGVSLANNGGNTWTGTITAVEGTHSVNVSARDASGNGAWNNSTSYTAKTSSSSPNLLANPGFENGTTKPLNWSLVTVGGNTPVWDSASHTGARSIKISISGTKNYQSGYPKSDLITASALKNYTLSAWVKTLNAGGTRAPAVRVVELDRNQKKIRTTTLYFSKGTSDWTKKQIIFQTTINTKYLYVYANIASGYGTFWVDDVVLSILSS